MEKRTDEVFDKILYTEVFQSIHKAMNCLYFELRPFAGGSAPNFMNAKAKEMIVATQQFIEQQLSVYQNELTAAKEQTY